VFAGRFAREKNIEVLCDALRRLGSPYHLLLIGSGALPALPRNVTVWPYERDAMKLATLLASCDVFVHAGNRETFGLVLLEAMACGLPPVVVRGGALAELVEGHGIVVERAEGADFAEGITAAFTADAAEIGREARQWVEGNCTWDHALRGLLGLYTRVRNSATAAAGSVYAAH
jgi:alpha-1,6-mannosyltransferase